jgi:cation transport ATPase
VVAAPGRSEKDVLALSAGREQHFEHPIAYAILGKVKKKGLK